LPKSAAIPMSHSKQWAKQWASPGATHRTAHLTAHLVLSFFAPLLVCILFPALPARSQVSGNDEGLFRGNHAELAVTVRDNSGEPIAAPALVKLLRSGVPTDQAATSRGKVSFILQSVGDYTVIVDAPGYKAQQKDISIPVVLKAELDVVLTRDPTNGEVTGVPGKPLLAPKAKEAFDKAVQALSQDKLKDAQKHVAEAVRLAPGHPDVLYVQGVLYLKQRNWADAQSTLEKATEIDPSHARAFAALGMAFSDQGKYDAAIPPLERALQLDPAGEWEAHWTLGRAYYHSGQYDGALKESQEALTESKGRAPEIEILVAQSLTAVGRYEESAQALRQFLKDYPDRPEAATARRYLERLAADGKIHRQ
jgi:tetratricopeptide (TPR) repeat protein